MSVVPDDQLQILNEEIKAKGYVDREHILKFLSLIPTNDAPTIISEIKNWLQSLQDDPTMPTFPKGDIDAILGDLDSYGRVHSSTILQFKENSNKAPSA